MALGVGVTLASVALGFRARQAAEASLRRRYRWAVRLALGYAAVLFAGVVMAGAKFAWAAWVGGASAADRAVLLGACLAAGLNLVLGFLLFGMAPTLVAFMVSRRFDASEGDGSSG